MSERARDIESKYSLVEIIANSTFYLPGSVLSSLCILTYLIKQQQSLMQVLFCIYFTDEEVLAFKNYGAEAYLFLGKDVLNMLLSGKANHTVPYRVLSHFHKKNNQLMCTVIGTKSGYVTKC